MPTPESSGMDYGDLPSWFALGLSLVSLGWQAWAEYRNAHKEKASIQLARIESFERCLDEVRLLATTYWMSPETESSREGIALVHHLRGMARDAKRYQPIFWGTVERDTLQLKIQITGGTFQQSDRPVYSGNDPFMKKITASIAGMSSKLKDAKDRLVGC